MTTHSLDEGFIRPPRTFTDPREIIRINDLKLEANDNSKKIRQGRYILLFIAGVGLLYSIYLAFFGSEQAEYAYAVLVGGALVAVVYATCAALTYRWPLMGVGVGLAFYVFDHGIALIEDPASVANGIAVKVLVLATLGRAIYASIQHKKVLHRLAGHRIPEWELKLGKKLKDIPRTPQVKTKAD